MCGLSLRQECAHAVSNLAGRVGLSAGLLLATMSLVVNLGPKQRPSYRDCEGYEPGQ